MNPEQVTKQLEDANTRIKNALNTCVTLSAELTEERQKTEQQAKQLDLLLSILLCLMKRHRYDFLNIEKLDLIEAATYKYVYVEKDPQSTKVYVEARVRTTSLEDFKKECVTETPGNTGTTPNDSNDQATSTTSHSEHNQNNEATALPS